MLSKVEMVRGSQPHWNTGSYRWLAVCWAFTWAETVAAQAAEGALRAAGTGDTVISAAKGALEGAWFLLLVALATNLSEKPTSLRWARALARLLVLCLPFLLLPTLGFLISPTSADLLVGGWLLIFVYLFHLPPFALVGMPSYACKAARPRVWAFRSLYVAAVLLAAASAAYLLSADVSRSVHLIAQATVSLVAGLGFYMLLGGVTRLDDSRIAAHWWLWTSIGVFITGLCTHVALAFFIQVLTDPTLVGLATAAAVAVVASVLGFGGRAATLGYASANWFYWEAVGGLPQAVVYRLALRGIVWALAAGLLSAALSNKLGRRGCRVARPGEGKG